VIGLVVLMVVNFELQNEVGCNAMTSIHF
jgi:hypothetical protein